MTLHEKINEAIIFIPKIDQKHFIKFNQSRDFENLRDLVESILERSETNENRKLHNQFYNKHYIDLNITNLELLLENINKYISKL